MALSPISRFFIWANNLVNRCLPWHKLPFFLGVINIYWFRVQLRSRNLYDTSKLPSSSHPAFGQPSPQQLKTRSIDGTHNDLKDPSMGSMCTRFGRNVPLENTVPSEGSALLTPNPRTVSLELMTRQTFQPATTLNLLAAAWIQFMVHDWFSHGSNEKENPYQLPLRDDDPWPERPMVIRRTRRDPTRLPGSQDKTPTFLNTETHWWDGSQIYGTDAKIQKAIRSGVGGKLTMGQDGLLPTDPETGVDISGVTGNWWIGLSLLHTIFAREHNAICDRLHSVHPSFSDDELFALARLINAALIAKIHTVEWTPGILAHPTLKAGMRGNWWGLLGEGFYKRFGRIGRGEALSGIPGSDTDHHAAPYSMTEEFVCVYRMHPLMPDQFSFRSLADDSLLLERTLPEVSGRLAREVMSQVSLPDLFYSFGTSHPGAITLHNYPRFLQKLERSDGPTIDLAAVDVLRDRERGVPRYNAFRKLVHLQPVKSFEELTDNKTWAEELRRVYDNDIERVDAMVGMYAEPRIKGFGFSETAFRIFILMASRRLKSDRFFTVDYTPEVYTQAGLDWINENTMGTVLKRHFPTLEKTLRNVENSFAPWVRSGS